MKTEIKKAGVGTPAKTQNLKVQFYHQDQKESIGKVQLQLGELLLFLQSPLKRYERKVCWKAFENLLRDYTSYRGQRL